MNTYLVVAAYTGECCMSPHVAYNRITAKTRREALGIGTARLTARLTTAGFAIGDTAVIRESLLKETNS